MLATAPVTSGVDNPSRLGSCGMWCQGQGRGIRMEQLVKIPSAHGMGISSGTFRHATTATHCDYSCSQGKAAFQRKQTSSLGAEGLEVSPGVQWDMWPRCCHLLPKCLLHGDAGGDRQYLEKGVNLSTS